MRMGTAIVFKTADVLNFHADVHRGLPIRRRRIGALPAGSSEYSFKATPNVFSTSAARPLTFSNIRLACVLVTLNPFFRAKSMTAL